MEGRGFVSVKEGEEEEEDGGGLDEEDADVDDTAGWEVGGEVEVVVESGGSDELTSAMDGVAPLICCAVEERQSEWRWSRAQWENGRAVGCRWHWLC